MATRSNAAKKTANQNDQPVFSGETCTVACKIPNGLLLQLNRMVDRREPVLGGGWREFKIAEPYGPVVKINGPGHAVDRAPSSPLTSGFAITTGVNKEFFEEWLSQHADADVVTQGLIFSHTSANDVRAEAREKKDVRSGLEAIDPASPPRVSNRFKIETDENSATPVEEDPERHEWS